MRKLLLATTALLGASVGMANAASLTPNAPNPPPGSITVSFNALVEVFGFAGSDSGARWAAAPANGSPGVKYSPIGIGSYLRLYPSFDGVLANGIKYGASIEIRQNGAYSTDSTGITRASPTLYNQRAYTYLGTDQLGKLYFGSQVQPTELFQVGNEVGFNDGGWDGDLPGFFVIGLPYFIDDDNDRANKVVYVSPQFSGVDFGLSFEPNNTGNNFTPATRISAEPGTNSTFGFRRNTIDGSIRYQGTFGSIGVKAQVGGWVGGAITSTDPSVPNVKSTNAFAGGLAVTFGGFEFGGHVDAGQFGQDLSNLKEGESNTQAWVVGGTYTIGPVIVGANYYGFNSGIHKSLNLNLAASEPSVGELTGFGIAAGGTYTLAPGASIFLSYLYGQQKQTGYDFVSGSNGLLHNKPVSQGIGLGTAFKW